VRTANLPEGFLPRGFHTDIVIVLGHARAHGVLFEVGAPFEPTIPSHDSPVSQDFSSHFGPFGGHLESLKSLKQQHDVALKRLRRRARERSTGGPTGVRQQCYPVSQ
jgi:hypothetical protein